MLMLMSLRSIFDVMSCYIKIADKGFFIELSSAVSNPVPAAASEQSVDNWLCKRRVRSVLLRLCLCGSAADVLVPHHLPIEKGQVLENHIYGGYLLL